MSAASYPFLIDWSCLLTPPPPQLPSAVGTLSSRQRPPEVAAVVEAPLPTLLFYPTGVALLG
jgi:hypothetical protein